MLLLKNYADLEKDNRVEKMQETEAFLTIKYHKEVSLSTLIFGLIDLSNQALEK